MTALNLDSTSKERQFVSYLDKLVSETTKANCYFKVWKSIRGYIEEYHTELNQASAFWGSVMDACIEAALASFCRIVDQHWDSVSVWKFLDFANANQAMFSTEAFSRRMVNNVGYEEQVNSREAITPRIIKEDRNRIECLRAVPNLKVWRDKVIAHIDKRFLNPKIDVAKEYPIEIGQVEELIATIWEVLNRYSYAYNSSKQVTDISFGSGLQAVLESIRFKRKETRKQWGLEDREGTRS